MFSLPLSERNFGYTVKGGLSCHSKMQQSSGATAARQYGFQPFQPPLAVQTADAINNATPADASLVAQAAAQAGLGGGRPAVGGGLQTRAYTDDEIKQAFDTFDLDKNRFVGAAEIKHILGLVGEKATDDEIDEMIRIKLRPPRSPRG